MHRRQNTLSGFRDFYIEKVDFMDKPFTIKMMLDIFNFGNSRTMWSANFS